ncbi:hypothetical protein [Pseudoruegeria sp. HB172150]|uniref:hypothetical protein n=1 Tax=Pseudoruegeria sp. HB172150 TaxID=2721164 RepID=UPI0015537E3E|nr:hypothetical protein [Pseudoruegeria sp. HB172150]
MQANIITFPKASFIHANNDDKPTGPAGNVISMAESLRRARMIRTLRCVALVDGAVGVAEAA